LLHVAAVMDEVSHLAALGVDFGPAAVDIDKLRGHKDKVVGKLTGGLAAMAKMRKVTTVRGYGAFVGPHHLEVEETTGSAQDKTGGKKVIAFKRCIIAAGSQAMRLPFMPDDPRVVDSTGALALKEVPKRMLILGGGIIGLEMGTVYSTLGARLDVVEMLDGLMQGADRDLVKVWQKINARRFDNIMLKTKTVGARATPDGIEVTFASADEGGTAPAPQTYDLVLQAVGRSPNGKKIAADKAGVAVTDRGFIGVDIQMRTNVPHIFAIGDIVGQPMLAHKAVHEGHVAAEVIAGELQGNKELASAAFNARVIPSVAYTDPEVAWVGLTEDQARAQGIKVRKGLFPWTASGRAIANGRDEGFTKLLFDDRAEAHGHGRILGGGIVGTHAGDMIGEIALAIEMGADAIDIGKTIHPHPTLGESIGMAAEVAHGSCTDLPPPRR
jgi:dihydrolipoamide dehydrogenase